MNTFNCSCVYTWVYSQLHEKLYNHRNNLIVQLHEYLYVGIYTII